MLAIIIILFISKSLFKFAGKEREDQGDISGKWGKKINKQKKKRKWESTAVEIYVM